MATAWKWLIFWFPLATIKQHSIPLTVPLSLGKQWLPYTRQLAEIYFHIKAGTLDRSPVKCFAQRLWSGHVQNVLCWSKCVHMQQCCKIMHHRKNDTQSFLKKKKNPVNCATQRNNIQTDKKFWMTSSNWTKKKIWKNYEYLFSAIWCHVTK